MIALRSYRQVDMASHARHARPRNPALRRTALRAALTVSTVGAALAAGSASASAAASPVNGLKVPDVVSKTDTGAALSGVDQGLKAAVAPVTHLNINPLAGTGVDPLDNTLGTQIADFQPVSTGLVTDPLAQRNSVSTLPVVGPVVQSLTGG
jgi:hypothetical protein